MSACLTCGKPMRHVAVRIPWPRPGVTPFPVQVEHFCENYGCKARLVPFFEDAVDEEAILLKVLGSRPGVTVRRTEVDS